MTDAAVCNECGGLVAVNDKLCPHCGAPNPEARPDPRFLRAVGLVMRGLDSFFKAALLLPVLAFFVWIVWAFSNN